MPDLASLHRDDVMVKPPILEVAILDVRTGAVPDFLVAFKEASRFIASVDGYRSHQLRPCIERATRFILLVEWDTLEAHTVGFRGSPQYLQWKTLLHHFYDPFPVVEHYSEAV